MECGGSGGRAAAVRGTAGGAAGRAGLLTREGGGIMLPARSWKSTPDARDESPFASARSQPSTSRPSWSRGRRRVCPWSGAGEIAAARIRDTTGLLRRGGPFFRTRDRGDVRMARVLVFDTTLRDGEQSPGATMTPGEKLRLAHQLDALGGDVSEAGLPDSSPDDEGAGPAVAGDARRPA